MKNAATLATVPPRMPRVEGPAPPSLDIATLEARPHEELLAVGLEHGIENPEGLARQDLLYRILHDQAERQGTIFSGGVLSVVDDGFGFLRGDRLCPGPNDVYVSQSQIRRFELRNGDYVTGRSASRRTPRSTTGCSASRPSTASTPIPPGAAPTSRN